LIENYGAEMLYDSRSKGFFFLISVSYKFERPANSGSKLNLSFGGLSFSLIFFLRTYLFRFCFLGKVNCCGAWGLNPIKSAYETEAITEPPARYKVK